MASYLSRLKADLPRWVEANLIGPEQAGLILRDAEEREPQGWFRLPLVLAFLGSVLVFAGIISLVASNWAFMPRLVKLIVLVGGMGLAFLSAHYARTKQAEGIGQGLAFLGALLFGANIMLIGQIYHLPPNPPGGTLLWALGALLVAWLWPSQLTAGLAFVLAWLWSWFAISTGWRGIIWEMLFSPGHALHWQFLLLWGILTALCVVRGWTRALHLAGLSLLFWCWHTSFGLFDEDFLRLGGMMMAGLLLLVFAGGKLLAVARVGSGTISRYLWVGIVIWLLIVSVPDVAQDMLTLGRVPPVIMAVLGGVLAVSLWALVTDRARPVAAAFGLGALVPLVSCYGSLTVQPVLTTDYTAYQAWREATGLVPGILLSVVALAAGIGGIIHGYRMNDRFFVNLGFVLFAGKLFWIYFDTVWDLDSRSGWLIVGGVLVIGLGVVFDRQRRRLLARMEG